jgi:hypothetical protein
VRDVPERPPGVAEAALYRLLHEIRRRREQAEGRYALAALSGQGWEAEGLRWAGSMLTLASLEDWAWRHLG